MQKVTYLLGAGASAQCLPVVDKMAESIINTVNQFSASYSQNVDNSDRNNEIQSLISHDLMWLHNICNTHYSVDTYAKKLYLNKNFNEYLRLKNVLSIYFTLHQKLNLPDKRYDNFWASILDSVTKLPKNLRIISWNYDTQLELSFKSFSNSVNLSDAYHTLGMTSFHDDHNDMVNSNFAIFKLNGSAKVIEDRVRTIYLVENIDCEYKRFYEDLFRSYSFLKEKRNSLKSELSFAWEHDFSNKYYTNVKESIFDTSVLVVIGYSFPYFNRKVDKLIINKYMPALDKVYFQAPDAENLKERFMALNSSISPENMYLKKDENQFTFPNELDI